MNAHVKMRHDAPGPFPPEIDSQHVDRLPRPGSALTDRSENNDTVKEKPIGSSNVCSFNMKILEGGNGFSRERFCQAIL